MILVDSLYLNRIANIILEVFSMHSLYKNVARMFAYFGKITHCMCSGIKQISLTLFLEFVF